MLDKVYGYRYLYSEMRGHVMKTALCTMLGFLALTAIVTLAGLPVVAGIVAQLRIQ